MGGTAPLAPAPGPLTDEPAPAPPRRRVWLVLAGLVGLVLVLSYLYRNRKG